MMMVVKLCVKAATAPLPLLIGYLLTNLLTNKPQEESVPIDHHIDRLIVICSFSPPPRHRQPTVLLGSGPPLYQPKTSVHIIQGRFLWRNPRSRFFISTNGPWTCLMYCNKILIKSSSSYSRYSSTSWLFPIIPRSLCRNR